MKVTQGRVVGGKEWAEMSVPDVYFSYEYYNSSAKIERDFVRTVLIKWEDGSGAVYLPLILREIKNSQYFDATSAYGYGGPWFEGSPSFDGFRIFLDSWAVRNNVVCTFLRFHPLLGNAKELDKVASLKFIGPTAGWDLQKSTSLVDGMSKDHRKTFRRAVRAGVEARLTINPSQIDSFVELYETSMNRLTADSFYHFSSSYWDAIRDGLGENILLVEAVFETRVVAAILCLFGENYLHYHLSGTADEGRKLGGAVLCRVAAAEWGQQHGLSIAHSGGGAGGSSSSLLEWKHKFDKENPLYQFSVANLVHDELTFTELSSRHARNDFFPPWRSPKARDSSIMKNESSDTSNFEVPEKG